MFMRAVN